MSTNRTLLVESLARSMRRDTRPSRVPVNRWAGLSCRHCGGPVDPWAPGGETRVCQSVACFDAAVVVQRAAVEALDGAA